MNTFEKDQAYVAHTYGRFPIEIVSGKGAILVDSEGKEYIDLGSGIGTTSFGTADETWIAAVTQQLGKVQHASNLYYTGPCASLAQLLCEKTGMKKVFFGNSGAEANECAIKVARKYAQDKKGKEYGYIITLKISFHGRTLATLAATGQDTFHQHFFPLMPGFLYADAGDLEQIACYIKEYPVAGIMIEAVQGEGGVVPLEEAFVKGLAKLARENDVLLIADEVQTGNGRTGELYGYMHFGIQPDIVSTAKGLGGGLPIGACLLGEKVENVLTPGTHGSTYGGNPAACAGAVTVIERLDEDFLAEVRSKSRLIFETLEGAKGVKSVSGLGLMIGIETEKPATEVVKRCQQLGVMPITAKTKVRLLPPLNITVEQLEKALEIIKTACGEE